VTLHEGVLYNIDARGHKIVVGDGQVRIYRGIKLIMTCAKENDMPWVYIYDLLKYINAPEQDQGPVTPEPQLVDANLPVNLLTAQTPGRLASLRREQKNND
jgi:hypothetical protein